MSYCDHEHMGANGVKLNNKGEVKAIADTSKADWQGDLVLYLCILYFMCTFCSCEKNVAVSCVTVACDISLLYYFALVC